MEGKFIHLLNNTYETLLINKKSRKSVINFSSSENYFPNSQSVFLSNGRMREFFCKHDDTLFITTLSCTNIGHIRMNYEENDRVYRIIKRYNPSDKTPEDFLLSPKLPNLLIWYLLNDKTYNITVIIIALMIIFACFIVYSIMDFSDYI